MGETDFRNDFIRDLWNKVKASRNKATYWLLSRHEVSGLSPIDYVHRFHQTPDNNDINKNRIVRRLVTASKLKQKSAHLSISCLLLLLAPNLKRLGCEYCNGLIPVYDPFDEACHAAYRIITKSRFKKKDLVLVSIIRRVRGALNRLTKKELHKRELIEKITTDSSD